MQVVFHQILLVFWVLNDLQIQLAPAAERTLEHSAVIWTWHKSAQTNPKLKKKEGQ